MKLKLVLVIVLISTVAFGNFFQRTDEYLKRQNEVKSVLEFSLTFEEAKEIIMKHYPELKIDEEVREFIVERDIQRTLVDGIEMYYTDLEHNLFTRDPELVEREPEWSADNVLLVRYLLEEYGRRNTPFASFKPAHSPYFNPKDYLVEYRVNTERSLLPDKGSLRIWFPLPLQTAAQENISVLEVTPKEALVGLPRTSGDIAYVLFEFDLSNLVEDLDITVQFTFTHYQQQFDIDPDQVGEYDKESSLYKDYTKSEGSIYYDERFEELARSIVGDETNPYLQAKKIYYYVVENIKYTFMAHVAIEAAGIPESLYSFEHGYGDCGTQSMIFSALCRSIGIPARAPGGFQVFSGQLGSHFWAEFYLPNYGWVPVDTSAGQIATYTYEITEEERKAFIDYFFGNQDPLRLVVQNSVDFLPAEKPADTQLLEITLQSP
ncbi:transglutaminase-like domain-containing protein, partial [Mesotoga sp.]|uniref:transglutaminase-like domain-containing protein n=1 Tax=Mesotoga sp. TaxID=2053577 RepID=UPI00345E3EA8